jgi:hypothetical protein
MTNLVGEGLQKMALYNAAGEDNYISATCAKQLGLQIHKLESGTLYVDATWSNIELGRKNQQTRFHIAEKAQFSVLFGRESANDVRRLRNIGDHPGRDALNKRESFVSFRKGIKDGLLFRVVLSDGEPSGSSLAEVEARLQPDHSKHLRHKLARSNEAHDMALTLSRDGMPPMLEEYLSSTETPQPIPLPKHRSTSPLVRFQENMESLQSTMRDVSSTQTSPQKSATGKKKQKKKKIKKKQ